MSTVFKIFKDNSLKLNKLKLVNIAYSKILITLIFFNCSQIICYAVIRAGFLKTFARKANREDLGLHCLSSPFL